MFIWGSLMNYVSCIKIIGFLLSWWYCSKENIFEKKNEKRLIFDHIFGVFYPLTSTNMVHKRAFFFFFLRNFSNFQVKFTPWRRHHRRNMMHVFRCQLSRIKATLSKWSFHLWIVCLLSRYPRSVMPIKPKTCSPKKYF